MENNESSLAITIKNFVSFLLIIWCKRKNKMKPSKMLRLSRRRDTDNRRLIEYFTRKCFFCFQALNPIVFFLYSFYIFFCHTWFFNETASHSPDIKSSLKTISYRHCLRFQLHYSEKKPLKRFARFSKTSITIQAYVYGGFYTKMKFCRSP